MISNALFYASWKVELSYWRKIKGWYIALAITILLI
jgi:hypothetical protein